MVTLFGIQLCGWVKKIKLNPPDVSRVSLFVHIMADKKSTAISTATPAPAASSASFANPARAAVAEAKLDMSLGI